MDGIATSVRFVTTEMITKDDQNKRRILSEPTMVEDLGHTDHVCISHSLLSAGNESGCQRLTVVVTSLHKQLILTSSESVARKHSLLSFIMVYITVRAEFRGEPTSNNWGQYNIRNTRFKNV